MTKDMFPSQYILTLLTRRLGFSDRSLWDLSIQRASMCRDKWQYYHRFKRPWGRRLRVGSPLTTHAPRAWWSSRPGCFTHLPSLHWQANIMAGSVGWGRYQWVTSGVQFYCQHFSPGSPGSRSLCIEEHIKWCTQTPTNCYQSLLITGFSYIFG